MVRFGAGNQMEQLVQPLSSILSRIHCCPPIRRRGCRTIHQWSSGIPFRCPTDVTWTGAKRILEEAWKKKELSVFTSPHLSPLPLTTKLTTSTSTTTSPSPLSSLFLRLDINPNFISPAFVPRSAASPYYITQKAAPVTAPFGPFPSPRARRLAPCCCCWTVRPLLNHPPLLFAATRRSRIGRLQPPIHGPAATSQPPDRLHSGTNEKRNIKFVTSLKARK